MQSPSPFPHALAPTAPSPANSPIVVLDSGLGGLTVARAIREVLPLEDIVYFGDSARVPYGAKSPETVTTFVRQIIAYTRPLKPKHVVIACNTATALAMPGVRASFPDLSVSGVIEPGSRSAVMAAGSRQVPTIGVLATEATVRSRAYAAAIHRKRTQARVIQQPAPILVPLIEEGRHLNDPLVKLALRQYLQPMIDHRMNVLVLGCTHYPVLRPLIERMVGPAIPVIDSARLCAEDVTRRLMAQGLLRGGPSGLTSLADSLAVVGSFRCFVSDDPERFARLAPRFLGMNIPPPTLVTPDELHAISPEVMTPSVRRAS
jgi:glutamate racemase